MTLEKVQNIAAIYRERLKASRIQPVRLPANKWPQSQKELLQHAVCLIDDISKLPSGSKMDKAFLSLGIVQGILLSAKWLRLTDLTD